MGGPDFNFIASLILPPPPRPPSQQQPDPNRRSMSVPRSGSKEREMERNKKRNSILVDTVVKRTTTMRRNSTLMNNRETSQQVTRGRGRGTMVSRWDGIKQTHSDWESIRRDPELWYPSGDALIHLYAQGHSRRGPSMRVPFSDIEQSNCGLLLTEALASVPHATVEESVHEDGSLTSNPRSDDKYEMYIPAPSMLDREQALKYHLTTRNFFAWMFDKPLVGSKLGQALIELHERMNLFRVDSMQNQDDMLAYIDSQGYNDFRNCPNHALAVLQYAEKYELTELWTDAFVHCAGMYDTLMSGHDFEGLSRTTKALITRANLEMNVRLERTSMSLANFMEEDLGFLRLSEPVVRHMERFRSCLHSYYVHRHGYWPPNSNRQVRGRQGKGGPLPKTTLLSMYSDFRNLYELLADLEKPEGQITPRAAPSDSFDVATKLGTFDRKQKFSSLPYVHPLLPEALPETTDNRLSSFLPAFIRRARTQQRTGTLAALHQATNVSDDPSVMNSPLVIEYFRFERQYTLHEDERLPAVDARKARWLLIYAILQMLADVTKAPADVRDPDGVDYPLCCQTAGTPPWNPSATHAHTGGSSGGAPSRPTTIGTRSMVLRRSESCDSVSSFTTSLHSHAPSARVDPLDLELVASKRLSYAVKPPAPATNTTATPLRSPKPQRPTSVLEGQQMLATYDSKLTTEPTPEEDEEVPALSPTLPRGSSSDGSEEGEHREEASSASSEADTPTSAKFAEHASGLGIMGSAPVKGVPHPPPSPSIYDDDDEADPSKSEFNLLLSAGHRRMDSDELARRWRGEIGAI